MKIAGQTDIGSCRQENQDNFCARQLTDGSGWGVVCDGMGGVKGGRVASSIATASLMQYFDRQLRTLRHGEEKQFILHGFDITNRAVYEKATSDPEMLGMGTTGVCAYVFGNMAHVVHAGDSRALLCTDGLTNMVPDAEIALILQETAFFDAPRILIDRALRGGGQDNITVLLLGVESTDQTREDANG